MRTRQRVRHTTATSTASRLTAHATLLAPVQKTQECCEAEGCDAHRLTYRLVECGSFQSLGNSAPSGYCSQFSGAHVVFSLSTM